MGKDGDETAGDSWRSSEEVTSTCFLNIFTVGTDKEGGPCLVREGSRPLYITMRVTGPGRLSRHGSGFVGIMHYTTNYYCIHLYCILGN